MANISGVLCAKRRQKWLVIAIIFLIKLGIVMAVAVGAGRQAMAFSDVEFQDAFQQFSTQPGAEQQTADAFLSLLKKDPANPLLMSYAGAATTKLATTTFFPWKKMSYSEESMAMLDKALQLLVADSGTLHGSTPVLLEVKFVAASTFLAVPGFMNRAARGSKLLAEVLTHPQFDKAGVAFRGAVWMRAALLAVGQQRKEDARRYLHAVIRSGAP